MSQGYYRFPTICGDRCAFISEDDLWTVRGSGGTARRLTSNLGNVSRAFFSPDGSQLAFTGAEEGPTEIYVMPADGGPARRLTYLGAASSVLAWTPDGSKVIFVSNAFQPLSRMQALFTVATDGASLPEQIPVGPATEISYGPNGGCVIGRNTRDPARWKRYRGGTVGSLWIDERGSGDFRELIKVEGNLMSPMWVGGRIYFISDHEGIGNIYSCTPAGEDLRRHTDSEEFYARFAATDGRRIVYHAGADLYLLDPATDENPKIDIQLASPRVQCNRKFVPAEKFLGGHALHPKGHSVALISRGKLFSMALWEGAAREHGRINDDTPVGSLAEGAAPSCDRPLPGAVVRHRVPQWLNDGERILCVSDGTGEERLEVRRADLSGEPVVLEELDVGRVYAMTVSPQADVVAISNHRQEVLLVDLSERTMNVVDRSPNAAIAGMSWSADGRWLAYGFADTRTTRCIKVYDKETGEVHQVTRPVLQDVSPAFDPGGKYLYFLSTREFGSGGGGPYFAFSFPKCMRPFLVTLRKDVPAPFVPLPRAPGGKSDDDKKKKEEDKDKDEKKEEKKEEVKPVEINFDGIESRIAAFPSELGGYGQIAGLDDHRVLFASGSSLEMFDFESQEQQTLLTNVGGFQLSHDRKTILYGSGGRLRALKAGEKPDEKLEKEGPGRKSGWLDLGRAKVSVIPQAEWRQMYREAWRLQCQYYWSEDLCNVDWERIYKRYLPLLERVGSRTEFSDLMWEMQGEMGTSHAYDMGGEYRPNPKAYSQGQLGAEFEYDPAADAYRVTRVVRGDAWDAKADSPFNAIGVNIRPGDVITAINGHRLRRDTPPDRLLVNKADCEVQLTVRRGEDERRVCVKALASEAAARYREWVDKNRELVHRKTDGRIGYLHIPDMGGAGAAEFHRHYLAEYDRDGLIIDVRWNGGGAISGFLLQKLAVPRVAYEVPRWDAAEPYPLYTVVGQMITLCNEHSASDGDIFPHAFKLMKLGKLIGKRTWGGVIGIAPKGNFVDGGCPTQPECAFWFEDVGWGVENYGTDPDIEVDITPQDHVAGCDTQLERGIEYAIEELEKNPPVRPDFSQRPDKSLPKLPPRGAMHY